MGSIGSEIQEFISLYGNNFYTYRWTDGDLATKVILDTIPNRQLCYPTTDISLIGVETIDKITLLSTGDAKIAISFDSGATWKAFKDGIWKTIPNAHDGMTNLELNALTTQQIELGREESNSVRFSYSLSDDAEVDNIEMKVTMQGYEQIANTSDYSLSYDTSNKTIVYNIKKSGTYSVNYVT